MINRFKLIISEKIKVSGIRGCMAAGAVTASIAALAVIGGINSDDISTVSLETDVIPEETAVSTAAETEKPVKRAYSHDIEYLSEEDIERIEAEAQKADEAVTETEETVPAADEATEVAEEESSEEKTDAEAETSDEEVSDSEADAQEADDTDDAAPEAEEESSESVTVRSSAADGDDDGNGLSSALDLDVNNENESADSEEDIAVMSVEADASIAVMAAPDAMEALVEASAETSDEADEDDSDIPEDITLDDETAPDEDAVSLLDVPEWLSFDENGVPTEYVNVFTGNACAYTADPDALMSTGKTVFQGYVAVDPDIIPYGSELYIVAEDGEVYGYAIAADTGYSVRKGHIIVDLFMNEYDDCIQWGNKPVNVYVLK